MAAGVERPLKELAEAFHNLGLTVGPNSPPMTMEAFLGACSKIPAIITVAFDASDYLVEEIVAKIEQMRNNVSNDATTLGELIDQDKANNCVRFADSNCRHLLRLKRAVEVVKVMYQELLNDRDVSLQTAAETAYRSVFALYHDMLSQTIAVASISELPTKAEMRDRLNETEDDEIIQMKRYVDGSTAVLEYVDKLLTSKEVASDW